MTGTGVNVLALTRLETGRVQYCPAGIYLRLFMETGVPLQFMGNPRRAIARLFAREGPKVMVNDINPDLGGRVLNVGLFRRVMDGRPIVILNA